ncbi:helix-turn-helix domain-containing protein [Vibrio fluvialis]|nr:helix-turn-helix domain-containing protein [Vibrio fluvialis]
MSRSYSTRDVRAQESFEYWQSLVGSTYSAVTKNTNLTEGDFQGELAVKSLGRSALITRIHSTPMEYHETEEASYTDDYFICLSLCPYAQLTQNNTTTEQSYGDIVVYDNNQPFSYRFPQGDNQIVISVPHLVFNASVNSAEFLLNKTLKRDSPLGRFVGSMIEQAWESEEQEDIVGDKMLFAILSMLGSAFEVASPEGDRAIQRDKKDNLTLVQQFIIDNIGDSSLSVESISQQFHMSSRTLSRLFSKEKTSVMRWVWQQRIKASYKWVMTKPDVPISDIAHHHGFSNISHFSKMFKETYGVTPSQLRQG